MHKAYIGIGTNIEPRLQRMQQAIHSLEEFGNVEKQSSIFETAPFGFTDQAEFLNAVVLLDTALDLPEFHEAVKLLEKKLGRIDRQRWHEREIDFDILFFDDVIIDSKTLTVPHPELTKRPFVLIPLVEIAPDLLHPLLQRTSEELLNDLRNEDQNFASPIIIEV